MPKYIVIVEEKRSGDTVEYTVEADTEQEAKRKAKDISRGLGAPFSAQAEVEARLQ